jgi:DNA-binding NarL/FixJ family response regulator
LVLQGLSTADIAASLRISAHTVQDHPTAIVATLGVRSRTDLVARVVGHAL